jgi:prepilin-type N-terminal cleavage/methylation domain
MSVSPSVFRPRRRAFTLIELLTVIAIIGILAAIIIPTVGRVRASAKSAACLSNLRQIGGALLLYANENGNAFPFGYRSDNYTYWHHELARYTAVQPTSGKPLSSDVFFCPTEEVPATGDHVKRTNYIANPSVMPERKNEFSGRVKVQRIQRPSQVIAVSDGTVHAGGASDWGFYNQTGFSKTSVSLAETVVPNETDAGTSRISWRHNRRTQVVFVDGHAGSFAEGEMRYRHLTPSY